MLSFKTLNRRGYLQHLGLFLVVEAIFVLIIFREFPPLSLISLTGILHSSYWLMVIVAGLMREHLLSVWKRFLATYLPIVYHVIIHIAVGIESFEEFHIRDHHPQELFWIIVGTVVAGVIIAFGEYYLHRTHSLEEHHRRYHSDEQCEEDSSDYREGHHQ